MHVPAKRRRRLLAIDPDYALAHTKLGSIAMGGDNDLPAAARHFQRALALDPTDSRRAW
jgi:Tfp pilus assembly protein PilF